MDINTNMHTQSVRLPEYTEYRVINYKYGVEIFLSVLYLFQYYSKALNYEVL